MTAEVVAAQACLYEMVISESESTIEVARGTCRPGRKRQMRAMSKDQLSQEYLGWSVEIMRSWYDETNRGRATSIRL